MMRKSNKSLIISLALIMIVIISLSLVLVACSDSGEDLLIVRVSPVKFTGNESLDVYISKINGDLVEGNETTFGKFNKGTDLEITVDLTGTDEFIKYTFELKDGGIPLGKIEYPENKFNINNIQDHMELSLYLIKEHIVDPDNPDAPDPESGDDKEDKVAFQVYHKIGQETIKDGAYQGYITPGYTVALKAKNLQSDIEYKDKYRFSYWLIDNKKNYKENVNVTIEDTDEVVNFYAYYDELYELKLDKNIAINNNSVTYERDGVQYTKNIGSYIKNKVDGSKIVYLAAEDNVNLVYKKNQETASRMESWHRGEISPYNALSYNNNIDVTISSKPDYNNYLVKIVEQIIVPVVARKGDNVKNYFISVDKGTEHLYYELEDDDIAIKVNIDNKEQTILEDSFVIKNKKCYLDLGTFANKVDKCEIILDDAYTLYEYGLNKIGDFNIEKINRKTPAITLKKYSQESFLGWYINDANTNDKSGEYILTNEMLKSNNKNGKVKVEVNYSTVFTNQDGYIGKRPNGQKVEYNDFQDMIGSLAPLDRYNLLTFIPGLRDTQQFISTTMINISNRNSYLIGGNYNLPNSSKEGTALLVVDKLNIYNKGTNTVRNTIIPKFEDGTNFDKGIQSIAMIGDRIYVLDSVGGMWYIDSNDVLDAGSISNAILHKIPLDVGYEVVAIYSNDSGNNIETLSMLVKDRKEINIVKYHIDNYEICNRILNESKNRYTEYGFEKGINDTYTKKHVLDLSLEGNLVPQSLIMNKGNAYVLVNKGISNAKMNNEDSYLYRFGADKNYEPFTLPPLMTGVIKSGDKLEFIGVSATYKKLFNDKPICNKPITRIFDLNFAIDWQEKV